MEAVLVWNAVLHRPRSLRPVIMAHRGASDELPENTLAAFARALKQGADVLETDIRFTRDDELVLMHDGTVDRTTNGTGAVAGMTLGEIQKLRARHPQDATDSAHLNAPELEQAPPSLAQLLEFTAGGTPLALELKDDRFLDARDAQKLIDLLARHNALERVVLVSFSLARLQACKRIAPPLPIGMITLKNPLPLFPTELLGPFFPLLYLNPLYVAWARRQNKIVCALDPNPEPRLGYYLRLGATVIMTNHPALTIAQIERKRAVT